MRNLKEKKRKEKPTTKAPVSDSVYQKPGKGRIAFRFTAAFLSMLFFLFASGLLYVEDLLSGMTQESVEGTMENPSSILDLPIEIPSTSSSIPNNTASGDASQTESEKQEEEMYNAFRADYELVQGIPVFQDSSVRNILLVGTDVNGIGDATILLSINHNTQKIHLTSIMRAMYVNIPKSGWFLFNHAYSWGGTTRLMQTIEQNFRVHVDEYIVVNFNNFPNVINTVGGVSIYLTQAEADYLNGLEPTRNLTAGVQLLDGGTALDYTRNRQIGSDFTRTERQRKVITALIQQALSSDLGTLNQLAITLTSMVKTNLSSSEIVSLASKAGTYAGYTIDQLMLPVENDTSGGHEPTFFGRTRIPYFNDPSIRVEAYTFDYSKNVNRLHQFLRS